MEAISLEGGADAIEYVDIEDPSGISLSTLADQVTLHPVSRDENDAAEDVFFWKAFPKLNGAITIDKENPKILNLTFKVFPDDGHSGRYGRVNTPASA
jgi:hypothetical protein